MNLSSSYLQEAQDTINALFNSVLGIVFNEDSFASSLRHPRYFSKPTSVDEIIQLSIETWLYDSKPIIDEVYREIVDQIYKQNLLIKNDILIGNDSIDLANITMPVLNILVRSRKSTSV